MRNRPQLKPGGGKIEAGEPDFFIAESGRRDNIRADTTNKKTAHAFIFQIQPKEISMKVIARIFLPLITLAFAAACLGADETKPDDSTLKPAGDGWLPLFNGTNFDGWAAEPEYWKMDAGGVMHGVTPGTAQHHYDYTTNNYGDFELHADLKLIGNNSGICIRIKPENFDSVPGYQVDMGDGYWGCLWEEHGRGKVVNYPKAEADKIVRKEDWNHYYIRAQGHHIEAWLNGVKTIDIVDEKGLLTGPIGFQLCHGVGRMTDASFKNVVYRPLPAASDAK